MILKGKIPSIQNLKMEHFQLPLLSLQKLYTKSRFHESGLFWCFCLCYILCGTSFKQEAFQNLEVVHSTQFTVEAYFTFLAKSARTNSSYTRPSFLLQIFLAVFNTLLYYQFYLNILHGFLTENKYKIN